MAAQKVARPLLGGYKGFLGSFLGCCYFRVVCVVLLCSCYEVSRVF